MNGEFDVEVIDTFPRFLTCWSAARILPLEEQIDAWQREYLAPWPELFDKQRDDYAGQGVDWRDIARERVFPFLDERLPDMRAAHDALLDVVPSVYARARETVGLVCGIRAVIHVGNGNGAGWVTPFGGKPAVLFGLENIAECGWNDPESLTGLTAHELGHVLHYEWRRLAGLPSDPDGAWWFQLYEEGFAQHAEDLTTGTGNWHEAGDDEWLAWCRANQARLARMFLDDVDRGESVKRFFGSWYEVEGHAQCGYFLGHAMLKAWAAAQPLREIACLPLDEIERRARKALEDMAPSPPPRRGALDQG